MLKKKRKTIVLLALIVFFSLINAILFLLKTKIPLIFFQVLEAYILSRLIVERIDEHFL